MKGIIACLVSEKKGKIDMNCVDRISLLIVTAGKSLCKGTQRNTFLFKCNLQHKCEQDLQIHYSQALRLALDSGAKSYHWRANYWFLVPVYFFVDSRFSLTTEIVSSKLLSDFSQLSVRWQFPPFDDLGERQRQRAHISKHESSQFLRVQEHEIKRKAWFFL